MEKRIEVIINFTAEHLDKVDTVDDIQKLSEDKELTSKNFVRLDIFEAVTEHRDLIVKRSNLHPETALVKVYSLVKNTKPIPTKPSNQEKYEAIKKNIASHSSWNNKRSQ